MKTATVTWITYNNYGTLLQAYALQKQIELRGHENVILYDEEILRRFRADKPRTACSAQPAAPAGAVQGRMGRLLDLAAHPGRLSRSILARRDPERYAFPYEGSQAACDAFKWKELHILKNVSSETLDSLNDRFDAFIAGSDQVWSVFDEIFNPYYYLDFAWKKKIAYAPCLGTDKIPAATVEALRELLGDFSAVSVRENVSARQLSEITGREVAWVCDPTLLHDRAFWEDFTADVPAPKGKYLLCYFLESKPWYFDRARALAKKLGLKIRLIPSRWEHLHSEYVITDAVGPKEFVSWFRHADYVLTDSYHGSIFSLIFEKDFQYLLRFALDDPRSQNIRIQSLFDRLELNDRIVTEDSQWAALHMDYCSITKRIQEFRLQSRQYLFDSLQ